MIRQTLAELISSAASERGSGLAVCDGSVRLSYSDLFQSVRSFGASLVASGIQPGDRVSIWMPNCAEWIISCLGLLWCGAVLVPINTRFKGEEAADILQRSGAELLLTVSNFLGNDYVQMLRGTGIDLQKLDTVVTIGDGAPQTAVPWDEFLTRATTRTQREAERRAESVAPDDPSDILFTSGTTGAPKGVVMTHGRTLHTASDWVRMTDLCAQDRYLMVNPYFHMFGLKAGILACVSSGAAMFPEPVFDVGHVLARVADEAITVLPGPPTLYQGILDNAKSHLFDLSSLRLAVTGAADIPIDLIRRIHDELPFSRVISGYGLTEAGTVTGTSPDDGLETIATTVGSPRPGFDLQVVDDTGTEVASGQTGEVLLRGPSVMSHYLDNPEATQHVLSSDGWLRTGDLGRLNENGNLQIVGRAKDMIIVGGFNVYPAEVESIMLRHPDIRRVAVIGIPDSRLGEVGMAYVVAAPGSRVSGDDICNWCRERMANFKVPRRVEIVEELPINATGKVLKEELRRLAHEQLPAQP